MTIMNESLTANDGFASPRQTSFCSKSKGANNCQILVLLANFEVSNKSTHR
jgi:hypothetical protein